MKSLSIPLYKYTVSHYRNPAVSEKAFRKWYQEEHLPHALPLMKKHGITKFSVHYIPSNVSEEFKGEVKNFRPEWKFSACDLVLEYWMPDLLSLKAMTSDPDWTRKAVKDEEAWVDIGRAGIHLGYETLLLLEDGQIVNVTPK